VSNEDIRPVVLAVDDTPENLDVVKGILVPEYKVKAVNNGAAALKLAQKQPPDIILLDVMMPDMDGHEVCRQLKANPVTAGIPVIFLTAKDQTADEAEGFSLGAADYIHKPVNPPILLARVRTHVALKKSIDDLHNVSQALTVAKERMEIELNVGRDIQKSMLPATAPVCTEIALCASMVAAREVGGDFYDYFMLNDDELCFCVADVSGKGVGAALFMAMAKLLIKSRASDDQQPGKIMTRVNYDLALDNAECVFVTVFLATINLRTGRVTYSNGGHNPPLIKRVSGEVEEVLERHGPVLAIDEGRTYGQSSVDLAPGDVLLVFTDGVTEAMNTVEKLYSDGRLLNTVRGITEINADSVLTTVRDSVDEFAQGAEQADDITMITLQYKG
jgi:serine phosphatase RsbU (regulator of sigma subunit)/CheY-like chemotaxis protein